MLGALGWHPYRAAHQHCILDAPGFQTLVTHIFDPDDPYIASEDVSGVKESLMAGFKPVSDPVALAAAGMAGPFYRVVHDFVLAATGR